MGGIAYIKWYKANVLDKIELAFAAGYDPALELASHGKKGEKGHDPLDLETDIPWTQHLRRKEQDKVDAIVQGKEKGECIYSYTASLYSFLPRSLFCSSWSKGLHHPFPCIRNALTIRLYRAQGKAP